MRVVAGPDAGFLSAEQPEWPFHVSALFLLDAAASERFSLDALRTQLQRRVHRVPQFRWVLRDDVLPLLTRPVWIDDPHFDVDRHLHHVAVAPPGDDGELARLVGDLVSTRLPRNKPLWEMWLIEGLAGGRAALLAKIHHAIVDGESGVELVELLFDFEADPEPGPPPPEWVPEPAPSTTSQLANAVSEMVSWPVKAVRLGWSSVQQGATYAAHRGDEEGAVVPFTAPRTPFNGELTPDRGFAFAALDLERCQAIKRAAGVKLNDVILALVAGALRTHLADVDVLPSTPLVVQMPVSLRRGERGGDVGTRVANIFVPVATDVDDPAQRLATIHRTTTQAKQVRRELDEHRRVGITEMVPPGLLALASRQWVQGHLESVMTPMFNVIVSNVAGSPGDIYVAGARLESFFPMGPLVLGAGLNFTVVSNAGHLDVGLLTCPDLVPDAWDVVRRLHPALEELAAAFDL